MSLSPQRFSRFLRQSLWLCLLWSVTTTCLASSGAQQQPPGTPALRPMAKAALQITHSDFVVDLHPTKQRIDVTVEMRLQGLRPKHLRLYLGQLIQLQRVWISQRRGWRSIPFKRQLETVTLAWKGTPGARLKLRYHIYFDSRSNYLYRQIFCQLQPGDRYFLHGWYPSLRPLADSFAGHLTNTERFHYTLTLRSPRKEYALSAGPLLSQRRLPDGRWELRYANAAVKEVALFFASGAFQRHTIAVSSHTHVDFFLDKRSGTGTRDLRHTAKRLVQFAQYYQRLWGDPRTRPIAKATSIPTPTTKASTSPSSTSPSSASHRTKRKPPTFRWRVIQFGGSGARGYPFTLLISRYWGALRGSLHKSIDSLFTRRQVLAHEIAHTWWGNAVTAIGPGSSWINEGLANYASLRALGHVYGTKVERDARKRHLTNFLQSKGPGALLAPGGLAQMARRTAYTKGTLVFYELERVLGRAALDRGLRRFFLNHRGGFATLQDLRRTLEQSSGRSLRNFFKHWVHGTGLPSFVLLRWKATPNPITKGSHSVSFSLQNRGTIPGKAQLLAIGPQGQRQTWSIAVSPGPVTRFLKPLPFPVTQLILDPKGVLFHGVRHRALLQQADQHRRKRQWRKAEQHYKRILQAFPRHGHALYGLALLYHKTKRNAAALRHYKTAVTKADPRYTPAWVKPWANYRRALLWNERGYRKGAKAMLYALLRAPSNPFDLHDRIRETLDTWKP